MTRQVGWIGALSSISGILILLVVLAGLIVAAVAYFKGKSRMTLLGAIGFLLLFLFSCCSIGWGWVNTPILRNLPVRSIQLYRAIQAVVLFLMSLANVAGFVLLAVALWLGRTKKD